MDNQLDNLLFSLEDDINKKCFEIKQKRKEQVWARFFGITCIAIIMIPTILVFIGVSLAALIIPTLCVSASFLFLSPLIIHQG